MGDRLGFRSYRYVATDLASINRPLWLEEFFSMYSMLIVALFFAVLAPLIVSTALAEKKTVRVVSGVAALGWATLIFNFSSWTESSNYNVWFNSAASKMLEAFIGGLEQGRQEAVLKEMRLMTHELNFTYEYRGNFKDLAERAAANLTRTNAALQNAR